MTQKHKNPQNKPQAKKRLPPITKKLRLASEILAGERYCDADDLFVADMVRCNIISAHQVYKAMKAAGYLWSGNDWKRNLPGWVLYSHCHEKKVAEFRKKRGIKVDYDD